jgi:mannose-6-phosphate isomerase-like protein (cupin superfamily)
VLKGRLGLRIGIEHYELDAGDSVYFDPSVPHTYRRVGKPAFQALIVTAG